ncbi:MAG TPA: cob(I)yrinic acid a,c-diamide adenosyltransferase [Gemmatimonadales bacterium]|nr:cob(I)yrinic acid a,c-diamide adenosyltransferase [Gemmatimonadales bacterium]
MKIYTKTGDAGQTSLFGGDRVSKDDPRVQAYGDVDEANAAIGLAAALEPAEFESAALQTIQRDLFTIGAELATPDSAKLEKVLARIGTPIGAAEVRVLEELIDAHEAKLAPLKNFILPGGTPKAAAFHLARTSCRRAERSVVALSRDRKINPVIIHYLNRLSDLLFVLARAVNHQAGTADITW